MLKTHRIPCSSPARASILAAFLTSEGWDATWLMSYGADVPTVLVLATPDAVEQAISAVGA